MLPRLRVGPGAIVVGDIDFMFGYEDYDLVRVFAAVSGTVGYI